MKFMYNTVFNSLMARYIESLFAPAAIAQDKL